MCAPSPGTVTPSQCSAGLEPCKAFASAVVQAPAVAGGDEGAVQDPQPFDHFPGGPGQLEREQRDEPLDHPAHGGQRDTEQRGEQCLEIGSVGLNNGLLSSPAAAPFGGVKQSGPGRESGWGGAEEFLEYR
jgi:hypothetical protein